MEATEYMRQLISKVLIVAILFTSVFQLHGPVSFASPTTKTQVEGDYKVYYEKQVYTKAKGRWETYTKRVVVPAHYKNKNIVQRVKIGGKYVNKTKTVRVRVPATTKNTQQKRFIPAQKGTRWVVVKKVRIKGGSQTRQPKQVAAKKTKIATVKIPSAVKKATEKTAHKAKSSYTIASNMAKRNTDVKKYTSSTGVRRGNAQYMNLKNVNGLSYGLAAGRYDITLKRVLSLAKGSLRGKYTRGELLKKGIHARSVNSFQKLVPKYTKIPKFKKVLVRKGIYKYKKVKIANGRWVTKKKALLKKAYTETKQVKLKKPYWKKYPVIKTYMKPVRVVVKKASYKNVRVVVKKATTKTYTKVIKAAHHKTVTYTKRAGRWAYRTVTVRSGRYKSQSYKIRSGYWSSRRVTVSRGYYRTKRYKISSGRYVTRSYKRNGRWVRRRVWRSARYGSKRVWVSGRTKTVRRWVSAKYGTKRVWVSPVTKRQKYWISAVKGTRRVYVPAVTRRVSKQIPAVYGTKRVRIPAVTKLVKKQFTKTVMLKKLITHKTVKIKHAAKYGPKRVYVPIPVFKRVRVVVRKPVYRKIRDGYTLRRGTARVWVTDYTHMKHSPWKVVKALKVGAPPRRKVSNGYKISFASISKVGREQIRNNTQLYVVDKDGDVFKGKLKVKKLGRGKKEYRFMPEECTTTPDKKLVISGAKILSSIRYKNMKNFDASANWEGFHKLMDWLGWLPDPIGIISDGVNMAAYLFRAAKAVIDGEKFNSPKVSELKLNAVFAGIALIPVVGSAMAKPLKKLMKGGSQKILAKLLKKADVKKATELIAKVQKFSDDSQKFIRGIKDKVTQFITKTKIFKRFKKAKEKVLELVDKVASKINGIIKRITEVVNSIIDRVKKFSDEFLGGARRIKKTSNKKINKKLKKLYDKNGKLDEKQFDELVKMMKDPEFVKKDLDELTESLSGHVSDDQMKRLSDIGCFVAGTLVHTAKGYKAIEDITVGEYVYSKDIEAGTIELKRVYGTYTGIKYDLYKIRTDNAVMEATEEHPFWVVGKGWVIAKDLTENDRMITEDGIIKEIKSIEHSVTSGTPIYNFSVQDNHNYFVTESRVLTHNINCKVTAPRNVNLKNLDEFASGAKKFDDVIDEYVNMYANIIDSNKKWSWMDDVPGADKLTGGQKKKIKNLCVQKGLIPDIKTIKKTVNGKVARYADFKAAGVVKKSVDLPENLWKLKDKKQFDWLDKHIGGRPAGTTWHHSPQSGVMELVPFGIHNVTNHNGGRTLGHWAYIVGGR